tara:strand:+ start:139 stop:492 length:354 start_codon:yes stop_codon:yes gene_type:complete
VESHKSINRDFSLFMDTHQKENKVNKIELKRIIKEELQAVLNEDEKFMQKASAESEKSGEAGSFREYCGGKVTQACVDRAYKSDKMRSKATLAVTYSRAKGGGPSLNYPPLPKKEKK